MTKQLACRRCGCTEFVENPSNSVLHCAYCLKEGKRTGYWARTHPLKVKLVDRRNGPALNPEKTK